jgi:hypothetical protein
MDVATKLRIHMEKYGSVRICFSSANANIDVSKILLSLQLVNPFISRLAKEMALA